jgi:signal transduction histidine kinase
MNKVQMIDGYAPASAANLALENERLRAELQARLAQLRACRGRMVEAIDAERRRIERDLHDGTQGRLVSLAMSLGLLEAKLGRDPQGARPIVRDAREAVAAALAELRDLSQGIYPTALAERGLAAALAELCERAALPVHLDISLDHRLPGDVEAAGYFLVSETLTNAVKHAHATEVRISVRCPPGRLLVKVADDGVGGATLGSGSGLRGLVDRIEGLGGRLRVFRAPGRGTTVGAEIPSGAH